MMADDKENLRAVWDGKIPVCFTLATDEVFTAEQPEPMFVSRKYAVCIHIMQCNCCAIAPVLHGTDYAIFTNYRPPEPFRSFYFSLIVIFDHLMTFSHHCCHCHVLSHDVSF